MDFNHCAFFHTSLELWLFCSSFAAKSNVPCRKLPFKRKRRISVGHHWAAMMLSAGAALKTIRHPFLSVS